MKLLKRDRKTLTSILSNLREGQAYLRASDTLVCRRKRVATTTLDFSNAQGEVRTSVDKEIGSLLALLHTGISRLEAALQEGEST
jgi:hypothetical protein